MRHLGVVHHGCAASPSVRAPQGAWNLRGVGGGHASGVHIDEPRISCNDKETGTLTQHIVAIHWELPWSET